MGLVDLLRESGCDGLVAVNLVDARGQPLVTVNLERRFEAEEMLSALWQVARENFSLSTGPAAVCETMVTTDRYVFLVRSLGGGRISIQIALRAYSDLEAARRLLTTLENALPDNWRN
jgi:hypothetical protein